jgi:hypothetical protein
MPQNPASQSHAMLLEGRAAGVPLGDGGSGPASSKSRPALEAAIHRTGTTHAQESGHRSGCPASADGGLVCVEPGQELSPLLWRADSIQILNLALAIG